ncbi:MAG: hypothetical protein AABY80_10330 [Candidatus Deferrimicrobiota bacterium]
MRRIPNCRRGVVAATALAVLLLAPLGCPPAVSAKDLFPGYPETVRTQAERVVAVAGPGKGAALDKEVRTLRIRMHALGILSINTIPDLLFERAVREGWKREATPVLRAVRGVSPFSVPMWAWLVKEDILALSLEDLSQDLEGLTGSLHRFGPAQIGYAVWLISFLSAAGSWFVIWASLSLFLRARPSLEGDVLRFLKIPFREYLVPLLVVLVFLLPLLAGFGLAVVACTWFMISAGYLRKGELVIMTTGILVLAGLLLGGGILHSLKPFSGDADSGGWLGGEGNLAVVRPKGTAGIQVPLSTRTLSWMVRFEKARSEMQVGNAGASERMWSALMEEGRELPEVLNNRGITRAQQGRIDEALSDFEAALSKRPGDAPALWNSYQAYLMVFNLERARSIQPEAWKRVRELSPYMFRPADMDQGEWMASALPFGEIWKAIFRFRGAWIRDAGESDFFGVFFRPLSGRGALLFLAVVWLSSGAWKLVSRKLWIHGTCLACGSRALVVRSREAEDICAPCRVKIGGGIRAGDERDRRVQGIVMHRLYVKGTSLFVPGLGALWSGKEIRPLVFGIVLSIALAGVSSSVGGERLGAPLVSELQSDVMMLSMALAGVLWVWGAYWGVRSFSMLQRSHNIAGERA